MIAKQSLLSSFHRTMQIWKIFVTLRSHSLHTVYIVVPEAWTVLALVDFGSLESTGKSTGFDFKSFSDSALDSMTAFESAFIFFRTGDSSREFFLFFSS